MKEYKIVTYNKTTWRNVNKHLSDFLNEYARNGWRVIQSNQGMLRFLLERDKNR